MPAALDCACSHTQLGFVHPQWHWHAVQVLAYVSRVRDVTSNVDNSTFTQEQVEANDVRCPDAKAAKAMYAGKLPRFC